MRLIIGDLRATTVTVPLEAPLRHSNGAHWGRFVRTVVEVETTDGIVGLGELGGGGESARIAVEGLRGHVTGHNAFDLSALWFKLCNPTASLYNNRVQVHAAIEFACLDIIGQALGVPVHDLLGGKLRDRIAFASYLFFRYANEHDGSGEVRTADQLVRHATANAGTASARTSSKAASSLRTTSSSATRRSAQRSRTTTCATTRTPRSTSSRRSASARRSSRCATTTTRTRRGA